MTVTESLKWRYAVKKYSDKKVEQEKIDAIIEAINLSASSAGLQPYRLIVVANKKTQKALAEGSFNSQISEASHIIVFAAFENVTQKHIDDYMELIAKVRQTPLDTLTPFRTSLESYFLQKATPEENKAWAKKQAYIGLGTGLIAAAELQVDTTPMEGFDATIVDDVLGLKDKGLNSVVLLALGYRDTENDLFAKLDKVRLPESEFAMVEN